LSRATARPAALEVTVQFAARRPWVPAASSLRSWARAAHAARRSSRRSRSEPAPAAVCIRVVGLAASRRLDRDYRGKDKPTNVLSFPSSAVERTQTGSIGDLVICAPVVATEARAQGKSLAEHWAHMVVHGLLHLHGYDHPDPRQARVMEGLEVEILRGLGYLDPYLPVTVRPA
jgi:probable rRNA maturation factor